MTRPSDILKGEPVVLGGAITATTTLLVAFGVDEKICVAAGAAAVAWLLFARSLVAPVPHLVDTTRKAAADAGAQVAARLDDATVGAVGDITAPAAEIVATAADAAADAALRGLGLKRKDRR